MAEDMVAFGLEPLEIPNAYALFGGDPERIANAAQSAAGMAKIMLDRLGIEDADDDTWKLLTVLVLEYTSSVVVSILRVDGALESLKDAVEEDGRDGGTAH